MEDSILSSFSTLERMALSSSAICSIVSTGRGGCWCFSSCLSVESVCNQVNMNSVITGEVPKDLDFQSKEFWDLWHHKDN